MPASYLKPGPRAKMFGALFLVSCQNSITKDFLLLMSDTSMQYSELLRPLLKIGLYPCFSLHSSAFAGKKRKQFFKKVNVQLHVVFVVALSLNTHKNGCRVSVFGYLWVSVAWTHVHWYKLYAPAGFSTFEYMTLKLFPQSKKKI